MSLPHLRDISDEALEQLNADLLQRIADDTKSQGETRDEMRRRLLLVLEPGDWVKARGDYGTAHAFKSTVDPNSRWSKLAFRAACGYEGIVGRRAGPEAMFKCGRCERSLAKAKRASK